MSYLSELPAISYSAFLLNLFSSYPLNDPAETVGEIGSSIRKVMGGTSGIMYISFLISISDSGLGYISYIIILNFLIFSFRNNRYDIFFKAAYAQLKANSETGITALQCTIHATVHI